MAKGMGRQVMDEGSRTIAFPNAGKRLKAAPIAPRQASLPC